MALISLRQLLDHAAEHGYGVPAFNVNNLEQTRAIMEAADQTDSPVIMQASAGASFQAAMSSGKFHGMICPTTPTGTRPRPSSKAWSSTPRRGS